MPIITPNQQDVQLDPAQRSIAPGGADTYAAARYASNGDAGGLADLAQSLSKLGGEFTQLSSKKADNQEAMDRRNSEFYASRLTALKDGEPYAVQAGRLLPELSTTAQGLALEYRGKQKAQEDALKLQEEYNSNLALMGNREASEQWLADRKAQAAKFAQDHENPSFGAGYLSAFDPAVDNLFKGGINYRTQLIQQDQINGFKEQFVQGAQAAAKQASVQWQTVDPTKVPNIMAAAQAGGKPAQSVGVMKADYAERLDKMLGDMPPELRSQITLASGYRSTAEQTRLWNQKLKETGGDEKAARKWVAPPGSSNHEHGEAADIGAKGSKLRDFKNTAAGQWVHANAEKYGLYFPMSNEPWHIEMRGGRREGHSDHAKPGEVHPLSDGVDDGDPVGNFTTKILSPNGPEGWGQNPNSTAAGPGQFIDSTWIKMVRDNKPEYANMTDDQIKFMKTDPSKRPLQLEMVRKFTQDNAERIKKIPGADLNETNLYIMHHAGEGAGPKIIKAADNTKLSDVMDPGAMADNRLPPNMTVGQYKEWAAKKVDGPITPQMAMANAYRTTDQQWGATSGLNPIVRKQAAVEAVVAHVKATGDTSAITGFPQEWLTTDIKDQFAEAARIGAEHQLARINQQYALKEKQDKLYREQVVNEAGAMLQRGEAIDLNKMSVGRDGKYDYDLAKQLKDMIQTEVHISPERSQKASLDIENGFMNAAMTNDYRYLGFAEGVTPTKGQLEQAILNRTDMKYSDRKALAEKVGKMMATNAVLEDPHVKQEYENSIKPDLESLMKDQTSGALMSKYADLNIAGRVFEKYRNSVLLQARQIVNTPGGGSWESKIYDITQKATKDALEFKDRLIKADGDDSKLNPGDPLRNGDLKGGQAQPSTPQAPATERASATQAAPQAQPRPTAVENRPDTANAAERAPTLPPEYQGKPTVPAPGGVGVYMGIVDGKPHYKYVPLAQQNATAAGVTPAETAGAQQVVQQATNPEAQAGAMTPDRVTTDGQLEGQAAANQVAEWEKGLPPNQSETPLMDMATGVVKQFMKEASQKISGNMATAAVQREAQPLLPQGHNKEPVYVTKDHPTAEMQKADFKDKHEPRYEQQQQDKLHADTRAERMAPLEAVKENPRDGQVDTMYDKNPDDGWGPPKGVKQQTGWGALKNALGIGDGPANRHEELASVKEKYHNLYPDYAKTVDITKAPAELRTNPDGPVASLVKLLSGSEKHPQRKLFESDPQWLKLMNDWFHQDPTVGGTLTGRIMDKVRAREREILKSLG